MELFCFSTEQQQQQKERRGTLSSFWRSEERGARGEERGAKSEERRANVFVKESKKQKGKMNTQHTHSTHPTQHTPLNTQPTTHNPQPTTRLQHVKVKSHVQECVQPSWMPPVHHQLFFKPQCFLQHSLLASFLLPHTHTRIKVGNRFFIVSVDKRIIIRTEM